MDKQTLPVSDNTPAEWEKEAVEWAVSSGLVSGDEHGDLKLHSPVTKAQVLQLLYRLKKEGA